MNEDTFTSSFKEKLKERGFFMKKLADRSTDGIPDSIICKDHKGFMCEIKYYNFANKPMHFANWSSLKPSGKLVQLTTMQQFDVHFLARYIFAYKIRGEKELLLCRVMPIHLLTHMQNNVPLQLPKLLPVNLFIDDLERFLLI